MEDVIVQTTKSAVLRGLLFQQEEEADNNNDDDEVDVGSSSLWSHSDSSSSSSSSSSSPFDDTSSSSTSSSLQSEFQSSSFPFSYSVGYVLFATLAIEVSIAFALLWSTWIRKNDLQYSNRRTYYRSFSRQFCNIMNILSLEACIALFTWSIIRSPFDDYILYNPSGAASTDQTPGSTGAMYYDDTTTTTVSSSQFSASSIVIGQSWIGFLIAIVVLSIPMITVSSFLMSKHTIHCVVLLFSTLLLIIPGMVVLSIYCKHMDLLQKYTYYGSMRITGVTTFTESANGVQKKNKNKEPLAQYYMGAVQVSWGRQWGCSQSPEVWCETYVYVDDCSYCKSDDEYLDVFNSHVTEPATTPPTMVSSSNNADDANVKLSNNINSSNTTSNPSDILVNKNDSRNVFTARHEADAKAANEISSMNGGQEQGPPSCDEGGLFPRRGSRDDATQCVIDEYSLMDAMMNTGIVLDTHNYNQMLPADQDFDWPTSTFYGNCETCNAQSPTIYNQQLDYMNRIKPIGSFLTNLGGLLYIILAITGGVSHILKRTQQYRRLRSHDNHQSSNTTNLLGSNGGSGGVGGLANETQNIPGGRLRRNLGEESGPLIQLAHRHGQQHQLRRATSDNSSSNDSATCPHNNSTTTSQVLHHHQQQQQQDCWEEVEEEDNQISLSLMDNSFEHEDDADTGGESEEEDDVDGLVQELNIRIDDTVQPADLVI